MSLCLKRNWLIEVPLIRWFFPAAVLATTIVGSVSFICLLCFGLVSSEPLRIVYLVVFGVLLFLFLWSYLCAIFLPLPTPPRRFNPSVGEERRFCETCQSFKPERAHHCRVCNACILKYDHHCFWINSCASYNNHKAFILFILYALVLCAGASAVILVHLIVFAAEEGWPWQSFNASEWILFAEFVFLVAVLLLLGRFSGIQFSRVVKNQTEVEWLTNVRHYDLGCGKNIKEVFGGIRLLWLFPVPTTRGDGIHWTRNDRQNEV